MKPFIYVPPDTTVSGWCRESRCEACTWQECVHNCHSPEDAA